MHIIYFIVLKRVKEVRVNIGFIQEQYVSSGILSHTAFEIKWLTTRKQKKQNVMMEKVVYLRERLIVESR